ncbi:MAG TPA: hypothetical protein VI488_20245 [Candidatus Angelobacter sp.]
MAKTCSSQLARARRNRLLIKFIRPFEDGFVNGYVLDVGPQFFLIVLINDEIRFNGFQCFRLADVRKLQVPANYAAFVEAALKKRGERMPTKLSVSVASLPELLLTANDAFPLITIHREQVDPDVCHIGRIAELHEGRLSLLEIGPDARWDAKPIEYRLREITRVDFGGGYEGALHLVGGNPVID